MSLKPGKRQLKSEKNRKLIYDCAIKLFRQYGYQNVAIEDIVEASGTSVGTFYHYFKSKDELPILFLRTYLQSAFDEYEERVLRPNRETDAPILPQLSSFLLFAQGLPHEGGEDFLRAATIYMLREETGQVAYHYMLDPNRSYACICRQLLEEGQKRGEIRTDRTPEQLLEMISIFSNGIDQQCYLSREPAPALDTFRALLQDFVDRILAASPH